MRIQLSDTHVIYMGNSRSCMYERFDALCGFVKVNAVRFVLLEYLLDCCRDIRIFRHLGFMRLHWSGCSLSQALEQRRNRTLLEGSPSIAHHENQANYECGQSPS